MNNQADIAQALGVSISTVSRALSGSPQISPQRRASVLKMAAEMNYVSSPQRKGASSSGEMTTDPSTTLSVLINRDLRDQGPNNDMICDRPLAPAWDLLAGASEEARRMGLSLNVHFFPDHELETLRTGAGEPSELRGKDRDQAGVLVIRRFPSDILDQFARRYRAVFLCQPAGDRCADSVDIDVSRAMSQAYAHLVELGHRHLGFVQSVKITSAQRFAGFMQAAAKHGHQPDTNAILNIFEQLDDRMLAARLLSATREGVTAWICVDYAAGVARTLVNAGYKVPEDVSLLAVSQDAPNIHGREMSHVVYDVHPVGCAGVKILLERLREPDQPPRSILLRSGPIVGQTTAPPRMLRR